MKKQLTALMMSLLMLVLLVPTAFAAQPPTLTGTLDLTTGDHTGKTLEADHYTWDEVSHTLTMRDLTITEELKLPKEDCTIVIDGTCRVGGSITRDDTAADQATTIRGGENARLEFGTLAVAGTTTVTHIELTGTGIDNGNVGSGHILTLQDSHVTLNRFSWMTDGGAKLENSTLDIVYNKEAFCQFWAERLYMDKTSVVSSACPLSNYGHAALSEFDALMDYIVEPAGGSFGKVGEANTIVDAAGAQAQTFLLKAPPVSTP